MRLRISALVVLLFVAPAFGGLLYAAVETRSIARESALAEMSGLLRIAIGRQQELISGTRQLLAVLAELPAIRESPADPDCRNVLARARGLNPYYANLGVATLGGDLLCSALPVDRPNSMAGHARSADALHALEPAAGAYRSEHATGRPAIHVSHPIVDAGGMVRAVLFAAVSLDWVQRLYDDLAPPAGAVLLVLDGEGTVLARHPGLGDWLGKKLPDAPIVRAVLSRDGQGFAEHVGLDGVLRIQAYAPLHRDIAGAAYIAYGMPPERIYGDIDRTFLWSIGGLGLLATVLLVLTWWGAGVLQHIRRMALVDAVTGLPSRLRLEEALRERIGADRKRQSRFALLALDLDRLRDINEAIGYGAGDELLRGVGQQLLRETDPATLVARVGAGTFAVLSAGGDAAEATRTAQRLREGLGVPMPVSGLPVYVEASAGIALFPEHGSTPDELVRHAVQACYAGKAAAGGVVVYRPEVRDDRARRLALAADLRLALDRGELTLHYQPKVELATRRCCGAEALARWRHPQRGMVPPGEFIPIAEHTGLIGPLTDWALDSAARQIGAWRRTGEPLALAVNLSARNLHDPQLAERLGAYLETAGVEPGALELEVTESALMEDPEGALVVLARLRDRGFPLYIDDFGTGYSSLAYLKRLPVDAIKIDKSFVSDLTGTGGSARIVRSTIALAHDLGLKVVAEGVESAEALECLIDMGCDVAQGYFVGRPMPAEELLAWLGTSAWGRGAQAAAG